MAPTLGPIVLLLLEAARSGWESRALARVLDALPRRYDYPLFGAVRALAGPIRRHGALPVLDRALRLHDELDRSRRDGRRTHGGAESESDATADHEDEGHGAPSRD